MSLFAEAISTLSLVVVLGSLVGLLYLVGGQLVKEIKGINEDNNK